MIEKQDIVTEFVDGEYYYWESTNYHGIHQQGSSNSMYLNDATYTISKVENIEDWSGATTRLATPEEKAHLKLCQEHGKYMPPPKLENITEFEDGKYYAITTNRDFVIYQQNSGKGIYPTDSSYFSTKMKDLEDWNLGNWAAKEVRQATKLEKQHLQLCQIAGKYLPKPEKEVDFDLELAKYYIKIGSITDAVKVLDCFGDYGYKRERDNEKYFVDKTCAAFEHDNAFNGQVCHGYSGDERPILSSEEFL